MSNSWFKLASRAGYIALGLVYGLMGLLAIQAALAARSAGGVRSQAALDVLKDQPFGKVLLVLVALGLFGYALFRLLHAYHVKKLTQRFGDAISAVSHSSLGALALRMALSGGNAGGSGERQKSAMILSLPGGQFILGAIGIVVLIIGLNHFRKAYKADFMKHFQSEKLDAHKRELVCKIGRFGLAARGVTFAIIGPFLLMAALHYNPEEAIGLGGAFNKLAEQPYGQAILLVVALGFVAFGLFCMLEGVYRRFEEARL